MAALSRTERAHLCDLALQVGPEQPTLCGDWTVRELVAHLVLRESNPVAIGLTVKPLEPLTEAATQRLARTDFAVLVERLRHGPPFYSWFRLPKVERLANTSEFFIHHEDIRRAAPGWEPRALSDSEQDVLWAAARGVGRLTLRGTGGIVLERIDTQERHTAREGAAPVLVRGLPGELCLFVSGRQDHARVELDGPADRVAALRDAGFGL